MSRVILRFFQNFGEFIMTLKERIKTLCKENGITVNKLEKTLGFGTGYVAKLDNSVPNTAKIQLIADYFKVSVDYLLTGEEIETEVPYYINDEAREMAQFMFENPEYKVLFDASRKISKADIETVKAIMDRFRSVD
jgi:transcriptional regulator with XRE-family HTH domain